MNIVLLGPQGSGKGTQARLLCEKFNFYYFETGEFLREIAKTNESVRDFQTRGVLVPNEETSSYITSFLDSKNLYSEILFDGFPRNLEQYKIFKNWLDVKKVKIDLVVVINITEEETVKRLSARRQDPVTGKIYNLITDIPPVEVNIKTLTQRNDDKPEAIKKRLEIYRNQTVGLINEIKNYTKVVEVDGERSIDEIQKDLIEIIGGLKNG